jgi:AcrR family transcriptional regulator
MGTRERLLEAAGQMFAARGFEGSTAKDICARAGANPAAVNYHFGGLEGLYEAVLVEVRERAAGAQAQLQALLEAPRPFDEKLRTVIALVVSGLLSPAATSWLLRLFGREVTNPTAVGRRILAETAGPRLVRVREVVGEFLGLPAEHPRVALACLSVAAPLQILLIGDRDLLRTLHPALDLPRVGEEALVEHFHRFAMAGLQALRSEIAGQGGAKKSPPSQAGQS